MRVKVERAFAELPGEGQDKETDPWKVAPDMQLDLPFLVQDIDRFGNVRLYVKRRLRGVTARNAYAASQGPHYSTPSIKLPLRA